MPNGKPAGVPCVQLLDDFRCAIFGQPERPAFCASLQPSQEMCGNEAIGQSREYAIAWLSKLELLTKLRIIMLSLQFVTASISKNNKMLNQVNMTKNLTPIA